MDLGNLLSCLSRKSHRSFIYHTLPAAGISISRIICSIKTPSFATARLFFFFFPLLLCAWFEISEALPIDILIGASSSFSFSPLFFFIFFKLHHGRHFNNCIAAAGILALRLSSLLGDCGKATCTHENLCLSYTCISRFFFFNFSCFPPWRDIAALRKIYIFSISGLTVIWPDYTRPFINAF